MKIKPPQSALGNRINCTKRMKPSSTGMARKRAGATDFLRSRETSGIPARIRDIHLPGFITRSSRLDMGTDRIKGESEEHE